MAIRATTYAPSKKPYAIDWSTYRVERRSITRSDGTKILHRTASVSALWVGRKNGATYVSSGSLSTGSRFASDLSDVDESIDQFMRGFDPRYGGQAEARWSGSDLWAPGFSMPQMNAEAQRLDAILIALPDVPAGHDGWYSLK